MLWKLLHDAVVTCLYRTLIGRIIQIMNVSKMESICLGCGMLLRLSWLPVCDMVHIPVGVTTTNQWQTFMSLTTAEVGQPSDRSCSDKASSDKANSDHLHSAWRAGNQSYFRHFRGVVLEPHFRFLYRSTEAWLMIKGWGRISRHTLKKQNPNKTPESIDA